MDKHERGWEIQEGRDDLPLPNWNGSYGGDQKRLPKVVQKLLLRSPLTPEEKAELYRKAIALAPDLSEARYNLALALGKLGKPAEAERVQVALTGLCLDADAAAELQRLAQCLEHAFYVLQAEPATTRRSEFERFVARAIASARRKGGPLQDCERFAQTRSTARDSKEGELLIEERREWLDFTDHTEEVTGYHLACPKRSAEAFARAVRYTAGSPFGVSPITGGMSSGDGK